MIYHDVLGRPESRACVSYFSGSFGSPATLVMHSTSDAPDRQWNYPVNVCTIVADLDAAGWTCIVRKDGFNKPRIDCIHRDTQAVIDAKAAKNNAKFANAERGYIRFGSLPESGYSVNHRDNTLESGVSVFEAEFVGKEYRLILTPVLEISYLTVMDRPAYRLHGNVVGTGADGEPVLKVTKAERV